MELTDSTIARLNRMIKWPILSVGIASLLLFSEPARPDVGAGLTSTPKTVSEFCNRSAPSKMLPSEASSLSRSAADSGDAEAAATYAIVSLCSTTNGSEAADVLLDQIASAIERLLEADQFDAVDTLVALFKNELDSAKSTEKPQHLHIQMALARLVSYKDKNAEALHNRQELQASLNRVFGYSSNEAIENRLWIANLQIETAKLFELSLIHI